MKEKFDRLIETITQSRFSGDIVEARKEYQKGAGEIYEDDKSYEARMGLFLEWFIFDRLQPGKETTLLESLLTENGNGWSPADREAYEKFSESIHGLFVLKKIQAQHVVVLNLFDDTKYRVKESQGKILFHKNEIFEGRLLPLDDEYFFSGSFCFHPDEAGKYIKEEIKKLVSVQDGHKKLLKKLNAEIKACDSRMEKNAREIDKLNIKSGKTQDVGKLRALNEKLDALKKVRSELHQEKSRLEAEKKVLEIRKIKIEFREACNQLTQKLGYMNLKWERSRQIDLNDIYRN